MTELQRQIIMAAHAGRYRMYPLEQVLIKRLMTLPVCRELSEEDAEALIQIGKNFGLVPKTPRDIEIDEEEKRKGWRGVGPFRKPGRKGRR